MFVFFLSSSCFAESITDVDLKTIQYADIYSADNEKYYSNSYFFS